MATQKRIAAIVLTLGLALLVSAGIALAQSNSSAVTISDFQFTPASVQVAQGTTVNWTNNGPTNHTTTSDTGVWDSGSLAAGKSFSFTFNTPGTFAYHCAIHPSMKGTITVTPASGASAAASPASAAASPSTVASTSPSPRAATSPSPSAVASPAALPKTGAGGPAGGGLPVIGTVLFLTAAASAGALWKRRHGKNESSE